MCYDLPIQWKEEPELTLKPPPKSDVTLGKGDGTGEVILAQEQARI